MSPWAIKRAAPIRGDPFDDTREVTAALTQQGSAITGGRGFIIEVNIHENLAQPDTISGPEQLGGIRKQARFANPGSVAAAQVFEGQTVGGAPQDGVQP